MSSLKPLRLAFFEKRGESFACGVGGAGGSAVSSAGSEKRGQMLANRLVEQPRGELDRFGSALSDFARDFLRAGPNEAALDHFVDEANAMSFRSFDGASSKKQIGRVRTADA